MECSDISKLGSLQHCALIVGVVRLKVAARIMFFASVSEITVCSMFPLIPGTVTHMPPELIERGEVSTKCDVYAFGIFMWECYTRLAPYKGLKPPQIVLGVVSEKLRPAFSETTPKGYRVRASHVTVLCPNFACR